MKYSIYNNRGNTVPKGLNVSPSKQ
jgi:hypothetical protein